MLNLDLQNHRPLREIVYDELKRKILTGKIVPGTRMMEVDLANDMGVSRTPVREAIRKLEKENLVTIEPRRGAYASDISVKDMLDILEVREDLEGLATSLAAARITVEQGEELTGITEEYSKAVLANDTEKIIEFDEKFHKLIVECSSNNTLISMVGMVQDLALRFRYLYYEDFSRYEKMPREHQEIIEAIVSGDHERARIAAEEHVKRLKNFVISEGENGFQGSF